MSDPDAIREQLGRDILATQERFNAAMARRLPQMSREERERYFALLSTLVTRLEEIDARTIEAASGRALVQYRGQLMPLIPVNDDVRVKPEGMQPLLVFSDEGRSMALVVDEIVDIVDEKLEIELASARPGVLGTAVIKGQATEIVDIAHFLPLAFGWEEDEDHVRALSAHVVLEGHPTLEEAQVVGDRVKAAIGEPFLIAHATLELECEACGEPDDWCAIEVTLLGTRPNQA